MQYRIETQVQENGKIILSNLPFQKGENIVIVINQSGVEANAENKYPLHGIAIEYKFPFEPISEDEWGVSK
jgi:hypothetical protein